MVLLHVDYHHSIEYITSTFRTSHPIYYILLVCAFYRQLRCLCPYPLGGGFAISDGLVIFKSIVFILYSLVLPWLYNCSCLVTLYDSVYITLVHNEHYSTNKRYFAIRQQLYITAILNLYYNYMCPLADKLVNTLPMCATTNFE